VLSLLVLAMFSISFLFKKICLLLNVCYNGIKMFFQPSFETRGFFLWTGGDLDLWEI
jgi:hypothetical protein